MQKRTDSWLSLNRLQLPLGEKSYGSIHSIADVEGKVKLYTPGTAPAMQATDFPYFRTSHPTYSLFTITYYFPKIDPSF